MVRTVGTHEAKTHLSEYLNRVAYGRERIVVERHGKAVAALVSLEDLRQLEAAEGAGAAEDWNEATRWTHFQRVAEEAGLVLSRPAGEPVAVADRAPLDVKGPPLSEQIVAERR